MILEQYYLSCLSQASYLIGDPEAGIAAVVDPRRDVDLYLAEAERLGVRIERVLLTHFHADFASGHLELAARTGATIHLGAGAKTDYPSEAMADGDELFLGSLRVHALSTPGHTPESTCFLVYEGDAPDPTAVLTGDTLFIGDVGRPDLMSSVGVTREDLARDLYRSTREKLMPLPAATQVLPGHGAGSACGKNLSTETKSTIGEQLRTNEALQPMTEEAFIALVTVGQPPAPAYFARAAKLNRSEHTLLEDALVGAAQPLEEAEVRRRVDSGEAQVLDARGPESFAQGHLPGSFSVGIDGRFAEWAGAVLDPSLPVVVRTDGDRHAEAAIRLGRVGLDSVAGYLAGDVGGDTASVGRLDPEELEAELERPQPPLVLDVRGPGEVANGAIRGSLAIPLPELAQRLDEIPRDREIVAQCKGGYRSMIAASLLLRGGFEHVRDLRGGMDAWLAEGRAIEGARGCSLQAGS